MSKKDIIQRLQNLIQELKEDDTEVFNFVDVSLKKLESEKSYFYKFLIFTKEEIDNLKFSKDFKKNKRKYFNDNIENIKELCSVVNIDYENLNDDELYELVLKPENVLLFKQKLFENIKLHINSNAENYSENYGDYSEEYSFNRCRDVLIEYLYYMFKHYYIFESCDIRFFLEDGSINVEGDFFDELYKGRYSGEPESDDEYIKESDEEIPVSKVKQSPSELLDHLVSGKGIPENILKTFGLPKLPKLPEIKKITMSPPKID
jgi:hypothetical protein